MENQLAVFVTNMVYKHRSASVGLIEAVNQSVRFLPCKTQLSSFSALLTAHDTSILF